jgi:hypothetical protein
MSAVIEVNGHRAMIEGGEWMCDDAETLARLRALANEQYLPDAANAYVAVEALGGKIISAEPEEPENDEEGNPLIY